MTDQKPNPQDDLREIADVLETDSHYSGSDESKRRARYAATLREHAAAMDAAEPVAWHVRSGPHSPWYYSPTAEKPYTGRLWSEFQPLYTHPAPPASEVVEALRLILPMAKGYAHANPVGRNAEFIAQAEKVLANLTGANNG